MMAKRILILLLILVLLSGCFSLMILSLLQTMIVSGALAAFNPNQTSNSKPGEWVMEGYNPQRNRAAGASIAPPLNLAQEYSIGGQTPLGSPVTVTADLVLVEGDHRLYALTRQGQQLLWSVDLPGSFLSPAVAGQVVFVRAEMDQTGYVLALQANSGEQLWQFEFPQVGSQYSNIGGHVTSPVIVDNLVLVGAGQAFYALEVETGRPFWSYNTDEPITSAAAVAGETILFTDFKQLYALDLQSGRQRWRFQPENGTAAQLFAPVVDREQIITTSGNTVYALDHQTGRVMWRRQISTEKLIPAGASGEQVYVKSVTRLYALDRGSGTEIWSYGTTNFVSLPAISENHLYVITRAAGQAQLRALNRQNGQAVWQVEDGQLANAAPVIAGQQLYVRTVDGRVWVYEPAVETR